MKVINLDAWAGDDFAYRPGEEIELDDETALARIEAGLAKEIEPSDEQKSGRKTGK